ncbi:MAG: hypothetical protein WA958_08805 [Tunicatimonas sp.]
MSPKNFVAYLQERFPPVNMLLFTILFFTVYSVSSLSPAAEHLHGLAWGGVVAVISFFFRLRVFDEIKDYQIDTINHPQRVLQSGRVTLRQLIVVALVGTAVELVWSVAMGPAALVAWLAAVGYSLLMRYEFFVGRWLRKHLLLYAISHMLIMPLVIVWIWRAFNPALTHGLGLLAALSLLAGFAFEVARKIHAPAAERSTVDSYSKAIGYRGSIALALLLLLAGTGVQGQLLLTVAARPAAFVVLGGSFLVTLVVYAIALKGPREALLRRAELGVSLFMLISYLTIIVEANLRP